MYLLKRLQRAAFGISVEETNFTRRGFRRGDDSIQGRLEFIGQVFLQGYHAVLDDSRPSHLLSRLERITPEFRGFAYEGAAMALALFDFIVPWNKNRLQWFLDGPGSPHSYMMHIGAGWALARLRGNVESYRKKLDPLLGWLVIDGYGFHEGYFHWHRCIQKKVIPKRLSGYARRAFDQGLGRSLWFVECADIVSITNTISSFPVHRHADLWSGIGLACAYAGGVDQPTIKAFTATLNNSNNSENPTALQSMAKEETEK